MPLVDLIVGARPNLMKIAPIIRAIDERQAEGGGLTYRLVHTGQHSDVRMSADLLSQLGMPEPDVTLGVTSGTPARQASDITRLYGDLAGSSLPDVCLVVGDVTSTMACAVAASQLGIDVAHVEAGLRSGDLTMPEEINRIVTDAVSTWLFTTSLTASQNLRDDGVDGSRIFFVGNTMVDTLLANVDRLAPPAFWDPIGLLERQYFVLTLHRPSNVDDPAQLASLLAAVSMGAAEYTVVFPVHPRTGKALGEIGPLPENLCVVDAQCYLEFNFLVKNSRGVLTDSGGVTEEATILGIPCITLRDTTERPETVSIGTNEVVGTDPAAIVEALHRVNAGQWKCGGIPELWDGNSAERIVGHLARLTSRNESLAARG